MALQSRIGAIRAGLRAATGRGVQRAAEHVADLARQLTPVDTGALRASIRVEAGPSETSRAVVAGGSGVDYAVFVEYGTSRMAAQPFMTPAAKAIRVDVEVAAELDALYRSNGI